MPQNPPLINGRSYGWSDIVCSPGGVPVFGIKSINYQERQEIDNVYGAGSRPVSRGEGRITYEGSLTLSMEELEKLQAASPTGRIQEIPAFPIVVSFQPTTGQIVNHVLKFCRFKNNGRQVNEGDMDISQQIDLTIGDIQWK